ncbi:MAG: ABC transporter permease, partial [Desulfobacterales bacterium]|nr:ABC transporter permease [Desulfobacterales bacterium]
MNDFIPFIIKRLGATAITLVTISMIIFGVCQLMPGDAVDIMLGGIALQSLGETTIEEVRKELGLNLPVYHQYYNWAVGILHGDLGNSYVMKAPIAPLVISRLKTSLLLAVPASLMMIVFGLSLGIISAVKEKTWVDQAISLASLSMLSVPSFLTGSLFIYIFSVKLNWIPAAFNALDMEGMGTLKMLGSYFGILLFPSLTLAFESIAYVNRQTRASMIEELKTNYVRTAVLKGVHPRDVVLHHALRNGLLPAITVIAFNIGQIIAGTVIIEVVFSYPGIGNLMIMALKFISSPMIYPFIVKNTPVLIHSQS